jgi:hypothetical protein
VEESPPDSSRAFIYPLIEICTQRESKAEIVFANLATTEKTPDELLLGQQINRDLSEMELGKDTDELLLGQRLQTQVQRLSENDHRVFFEGMIIHQSRSNYTAQLSPPLFFFLFLFQECSHLSVFSKRMKQSGVSVSPWG